MLRINLPLLIATNSSRLSNGWSGIVIVPLILRLILFIEPLSMGTLLKISIIDVIIEVLPLPLWNLRARGISLVDILVFLGRRLMNLFKIILRLCFQLLNQRDINWVKMNQLFLELVNLDLSLVMVIFLFALILILQRIVIVI